MSEELRPCPFCGGKTVTSTFFDWEDLEYMAIEVNDSESIDGEVTCENERCINGWYLPPEAWNTRPIEDALHARIAELEAEKCVLVDQQREVKNHLIDKNLHIDSLYEEGYKLQQRIAELEAAQRWIPVEERLPEFNKVVAVIDMSDKDSHLCNVYETAILVEVRGDTRFGFIGHSGWDSSDVTHWMPLPEPPEV
jgi:hypothetical protein